MAQDVSLQGYSPNENVLSYGLHVFQTLKLVWPIFLGQVATSSMNVVDTIMAGMAGTVELSGVAIGSSFFFPAVLFVMGMTFAIQPTIAQLRGAGKSEQIANSMHLATVVCLSVSVVIGIVVMLMPLIYLFVEGIDQSMIHVAQGYLIAVGLGIPAFSMYSILRGYWEGLGFTLPTLILGFIALMLNIPLNYIFIFGKFGVPALGGIGCGVATTLTMYLTVVIGIIYIKRHPFFKQYPIYQQWLPLSWYQIKRFLYFSIPLAISTTIEVACFSLVALLLSPFGPVVVASHSIAMNVSGLLFIIPLSIGAATTVRIGEYMGARAWQNSKRSTIVSFSITLFFYIFCLVGLLLGNDLIISLYSSDPQVTSLASLLLLFGTAYLLPDCLQAISIGILRGFKDSRIIFLVTIFSYWIVGMPVGYSLAYGL